MNNYVCVIGGSNLDICATPYNKPIDEDSNPGKVMTSYGGVGRNVAESLVKLGLSVEFITAVGTDDPAESFKKDCKKKNINIGHSICVDNGKTSTYVCINNEAGNIKVAVSDMGIVENITPAFLNTKIQVINNAKVCMVDANIPEKSLNYLLSECKSPIFLDTVSVNKAHKLKGNLKSIHTIKPNLAEAELITGMKIKNLQNLKKASSVFFNQGIKQLFISMGSNGVFYSDGKDAGIAPCLETTTVNTNGAGDCFTAALIYSFLNNMNVCDVAKFAQAAASICVTSEHAVSEKLSLEHINLIMGTEE